MVVIRPGIRGRGKRSEVYSIWSKPSENDQKYDARIGKYMGKC